LVRPLADLAKPIATAEHFDIGACGSAQQRLRESSRDTMTVGAERGRGLQPRHTAHAEHTSEPTNRKKSPDHVADGRSA
jgi:hypothetical protein